MSTLQRAITSSYVGRHLLFVMSVALIATYSYRCVLQINAKELQYEDETGVWPYPETAVAVAVPNSGFHFQCVH